jgi:3-dehydroquinate synthase
MTPLSSVSHIPYQMVDVDLGERSYPIYIGAGLLAHGDEFIGDLVKDRHAIIVTDYAVAGSHFVSLKGSLEGIAERLDAITMPGGEPSKSVVCFDALIEQILTLNIDRDVILIALGGGVIGDLTGYVAASLLRGVDFIQVPTTLMAQVDSSVGGKTGINAKAGKNLIGAFHQPRAVLADMSTLSTLPIREIRAGYAEIVKYGLLGDAKLFDWLDQNQDLILQLNPVVLTETVKRCCLAKAQIVAEDERESGKRALLNLGHTFAHAYEVEANYDGSVLHGEAVAAGIVDAYRLAVRLGYVDEEQLLQIKIHLSRAGLPTNRTMLSNLLGGVSADVLIGHMQKDKKARNGAMTFIVPHGIGDARVDCNVDIAHIKAVLEAQD